MTRDAEHTPTGYEDAASVVVNQAPAPSSLAGGEVQWGWRVRSKPGKFSGDRPWHWQIDEPAGITAENCEYEPVYTSILAALSPEAPARVGVVKACADFQEAVDYFEADVADALAEDSERADLWDREVTVNIDALKTVMNAAVTPRHEAPARDELPEDDELPGDFLARVGMDGALWATEFRKMALKLGYSDMDEGWLIGWFCNAVMAGYDHAQRKFDPALTPRHEAQADPCASHRSMGIHIDPCCPHCEAPAEGAGELIATIRTRLIGVSPDDQDVVLEDDDWLMIVSALEAAK